MFWTFTFHLYRHVLVQGYRWKVKVQNIYLYTKFRKKKVFFVTCVKKTLLMLKHRKIIFFTRVTKKFFFPFRTNIECLDIYSNFLFSKTEFPCILLYVMFTVLLPPLRTKRHINFCKSQTMWSLTKHLEKTINLQNVKSVLLDTTLNILSLYIYWIL